jgi:dipeptidyl aminopeptidase/acylaminoacyl peptidase
MRNLAVAVLCLSLTLGAIGTQKRPLNHSDYDTWQTIKTTAISANGQWALYVKGPFDGDNSLIVTRTDGSRSITVERGNAPRFMGDSAFVVAMIQPLKKDVDQARKEKKKPEDQPKPSLGILELSTGQLKTIEKVRSFRMPDRKGEWIAYQPEPPAPKPPDPNAPKTEGEQKPAKKRDHAAGAEWKLLHVASGREHSLADVDAFVWREDGSDAAYSVSTKTGEGDGAYRWLANTEVSVPLLTGLGRYSQLVMDDDTQRIVFLTDRDDYAAETPSLSVYCWTTKGDAVKIADSKSAGFPDGWMIPNRGGLSFSHSANRVFFAGAPIPPKEEKDETPPEEKVVVDIWNWQDPLIQPMQLMQATSERNRTYEFMVSAGGGKVHQLETPELPNATVGSRGDGNFATLSTSLPYRPMVSYDGTYNDVYLLNLETGEKTHVLSQEGGAALLSPNSAYMYWYSEPDRAWYSMSTWTGRIVLMSKGIPHPLHDEEHDAPSLAGSYGLGGWLEDDSRVLINDSHDIWIADPSGEEQPIPLTDGFGRARDIELRVQTIGERENPWFRGGETIYLSGRHRRTKERNLYTISLEAGAFPRKVVGFEKAFNVGQKARDANIALFTRSDFDEFPDVWCSDLGFANPRKLSDLDEQRKQYSWGTSELISWISSDGAELQGVLYKPEGFSHAKKLPMIVYFYERLSDNLHSFYHPAPGSGSVNISFYVSRGYVVFTPDIPYRIGYPGQSAMHAIIPGVQEILSRGGVDPKKIGLQGHSWGGYQIAYMITQTNLFACAEAGAPVSNMVSAYGGIRWQTGMSRQFQYEKTQSRIGGTLWDKPLQFLENSPVFWADKVNTPLLMLHNDNDGAVPWYQGIEYYMALRRLEKPVWMVNYNGEGHGIGKRPNQKDWAIRMQQFFDHYLMGAPMPVWMAEGVPATQKGKTLGLDYSKGG